jgi:hypothetical protein
MLEGSSEGTITGNNEAKMSNNEAFLAFLSKNEGSEDDEE